MAGLRSSSYGNNNTDSSVINQPIFGCSFHCPLACLGDIKDTPTCNIAQTVQAVSCNTGSHRYTNIDSVATQSQVSAVTSSSKVQGLYNEQAEQCYTRRDDTKYHKSDRRMVAADVQVEAADTSWSKCVASHHCRFSSPG
ncbi:hypothetical protein ACOSQ4_032143 [Xanthoceras sorbifolium]